MIIFTSKVNLDKVTLSRSQLKEVIHFCDENTSLGASDFIMCL